MDEATGRMGVHERVPAFRSIDDVSLGSIEYAVEHLKSPLIFVLGHERCGAVKAASTGGEAPAHLGSILEPIMPAVKAAKAKGGDVPEYAMRGHVLNMVEQLRKSKPLLAELIGEGKLSVAGGRYDLDTGKVEILE